MKVRYCAGWILLGSLCVTGTARSEVYKCPGTPVLYTDQLSAQEARARGCSVIESTPITVIQGRTPTATKPAGSSAENSARPADSRIDPQAQRARDTDSRRILENELRQQETRLAALKTEYNDGQPERQGNERNYQKYLDRVAELKSGIDRKEGDIAAIKRELAKLPP